MWWLLSLCNWGGPLDILDFCDIFSDTLQLTLQFDIFRSVLCCEILYRLPGDLDQLLCGEEKFKWNLYSVILKMEAGFALVKLVKQDSSSLIKYNCILLLPWWIWVWVSFLLTWTPKMEMPKATTKKLSYYLLY